VGPGRTGIAARDLSHLRRRQVQLPGTVDSSPIYLARVKVKGRRRRGVFFVTTTYGITLAVDSSSGRILWKFEPNGIGAWRGSYQITNTTPWPTEPPRHLRRLPQQPDPQAVRGERKEQSGGRCA